MFDRVIFSYKCENNTIRKTVEEAVKRKISLAFVNLEGANLSGIDLRNANLSYANLLGANLYMANLCGTDLTDTKIDYPMDIPEGEFIGWKKVYDSKKNSTVIIKLKILEDSKRSRATTNKCRCNKALVLEIQNLDGSKSDLTEVVNTNYKKCAYKIGKIVRADSWDEDGFNECSHGIHFFLDRKRAVEYNV